MRRLRPGGIRGAPALVILLVTSTLTHADSGPGSPTGDDTPVVLRIRASKADRDRVRAKLATAERSLPKPSSTFRLSPEGEERHVGQDAGKLDPPDAWHPIQAHTSRVYETRAGDGDDERTLEIHLALNGEHGLSGGLASVGGEAEIVPLKGALAVRQSIIGAGEGSRVAVPLTPEAARRALTLLRVYVVSPELETRLRRTVEETWQLPRLDDTHVIARRPDEVATVVVEIRGERRDVEALGPRIDVAALRKLVKP